MPEHDFELGCVRLLGEASDYDCSFSEPIMCGKSVSHVKRTDERRRLCVTFLICDGTCCASELSGVVLIGESSDWIHGPSSLD